MHFSLPNNRPPEQGSHWAVSDCNLVRQTQKLPAIISSFSPSNTDLQWLTGGPLLYDNKEDEIWQVAPFPKYTDIFISHAACFGVVCEESKGPSYHFFTSRFVQKAKRFLGGIPLLPAEANCPLNLKSLTAAFQTKGLEYIPITFLIWLLKSQVGDYQC